ncbi:uncharacterized protein E0L32_000945 [Thyridium curvatum]|uniref:Uncharacterized protein n=1 Tax=Thyridium curvatum TaxID=1093900 RepID=A0A507B7M3_9PEZI|nr:uncharacterized protein E0L32_000945 [Thyridium curvatum]TPX12768.1 hypothetical protein E0L32_000945 [Thyridium curvatum]
MAHEESHAPPHAGHPNPGTAAAVNSRQNPHWNESMFSCCSPFDLCMATWCFPCVTYGKTEARRKDPSLKDYNGVNNECLVYCGLSVIMLGWIPQMRRRKAIREQYGIEGSSGGDCMTVCFCPCCGLIQDDKEVTFRESFGKTEGYQRNGDMTYP